MLEGWRRNLYVIWLATFASLAGGSLAQPFLPLFINRDLGVSDPGMAAVWVGIATTGSGLAQAVMAPFWGVLADRHGRKAMLVRAQYALTMANALTALVGAPWQLATLRVAQGMFSGVVGASRALVAGSVPRDRVPYAMGLIQSAIFMGQTLGPTVGGILGSAFGFRAAFVGTAGANAIAGTLAVLYVKEHRIEGIESRRTAGRGGMREMLRSRPLTTLVATFFLTSAATMGSRPILPLLLQDIDPGHDVAFTAGLAFSALGVAGAVASVASSRGGGRLGLKHLVIASSLVAGVSTFCVSLATSPGMVLAVLLVVGLAQGTLASASTALVSLFAPANRQGTAFGILTSAQALAMGTGPLMGGVLASLTDLRLPFVASGALLTLGGLLVLTVPPPPVTSESELAAS